MLNPLLRGMTVSSVPKLYFHEFYTHAVHASIKIITLHKHYLQPQIWAGNVLDFVPTCLGNDSDIYYRPQGKVMFSQMSVCLSTIGLMDTGSLLGLVMVGLVNIILECFLVLCVKRR